MLALGAVKSGQQLFISMASAPKQRRAEIAGGSGGGVVSLGGVVKWGRDQRAGVAKGAWLKGGRGQRDVTGRGFPARGAPARRVRWQRGSRCGAVRSHDLPQVRADGCPRPSFSPPSLPGSLGVVVGSEALLPPDAPYEVFSPFSCSCPACRCLVARGAVRWWEQTY